MKQRAELLEKIRQRPEVSVLIFGGGINGVGLLRELALQGVDCYLVDKADFATGATSKSTRMIHGGLRYLENGEFRLVRESLLERNRLLENAPHYVSPLRTTIPLFSRLGGLIKSPLIFLGLPLRPGGRGALIVKMGLAFYDFVTRKGRKTPRHFLTGRKESLHAMPGLHPDIVATATYWDACISQAERICIELIDDAVAAQPESVAVNYVQAQGLEDGAVRLVDRVGGEEITIRPRVLVNATGAWVDKANASLGLGTHFMGGTKGSHLVIENARLREALGDRMVYYEHRDGRICVAFAFQGRVIMGSTDIRVDDPDAARCESDEVEYMLETLRGVFPSIEISPAEILFKFCGVRPLPAASSDVTGKISRDHRIEWLEAEGARSFPVACLIGGKWTTFRALAEQAADQILSHLGVSRRTSTAELPIGGGRDYPSEETDRERWITELATSHQLARGRAESLLSRYGTKARQVAASFSGDDWRPLDSLPGYFRGEIRRIASDEHAVHLTDIVCRRSTIAITGEATPRVLEELADIAGDVLGWSAQDRSREVEAARRELEP